MTNQPYHKSTEDKIMEYCRALPGVVGMRQWADGRYAVMHLGTWASAIDDNGKPNPSIVLACGPTWEAVAFELGVLS